MSNARAMFTARHIGLPTCARRQAYHSVSDRETTIVLGMLHPMRCERKMEDRAAPLPLRGFQIFYQFSGMVRNQKLALQEHKHFGLMAKIKQRTTSHNVHGLTWGLGESIFMMISLLKCSHAAGAVSKASTKCHSSR